MMCVCEWKNNMKESMKSSNINVWFNNLVIFFSIFSPLEPSSMFNSYSATQPHPPDSRFSGQKHWQYLFAICIQGTSLAYQQGAHQTRICISYGIHSRKVHPSETGRILSSGACMGGYCPAICYFLKGIGHQARVGWACRENMGLISHIG